MKQNANRSTISLVDLIESEPSSLYEAIKDAISAGADVNERKDYRTPLMTAFSCTHDVDIMRLLLTSGADVNAYNGYGETALHKVVSFYDEIEIAKLLIEFGANVNAQNSVKQTPLMHLVKNDYLWAGQGDCSAVDFFYVLLDSGADIHLQDRDGETALHYAVCLPGYDMTDALLSAGADANARDTNGRTPLMHAMNYCGVISHVDDDQMKNLHYLLEYGADVEAQDNYGLSVMDYARVARVPKKVVKLISVKLSNRRYR